MIVLLVQIHVKPDAIAAFEAATKDNAANSRREPGVARFDFVQEQNNATRFVLIEVYRDAQAMAAHKTTAHYLRWRDAVGGMMAEPRVGTTYTSVSPDDGEW